MDPIAAAISTLDPSLYGTQLLSGGSAAATSASPLPALEQVLLSGAAQPGAALTYGPYAQPSGPTVDPQLAASIASDAAANLAIGVSQPTADLSIDSGLASLMQADPALAQDFANQASTSAVVPATSGTTTTAAPTSTGPTLSPADDLSLATTSFDAQTSTALLGAFAATSGASPGFPSSTDPSTSLLGASGSLDALNTLGSAALSYLSPGQPAPGSLFSGLA